MSPFHPDWRKKIMNHHARGDAFTPPTTYWLALHTTSLTTANLPSSVNEVARTGTGYARMPVTTAMLSSATSANSSVVLTTGVQFADPLTNWTTIYAVSVHDSSVTSGGSASTCVAFTNVVTTVNVSAGNPVRLSSGSTLGFSWGLS